MPTNPEDYTYPDNLSTFPSTNYLGFSSEMPDTEPKKIYTDLIALRKKIGGLKAEKKGGVQFPVKSAKDLMDKLRKAADELNMPMAGAPVAMEYSERPTRAADGTDKGTIVTCKTTVRFMSDDGSYVDFTGFGQGGDTQDKAGGKASTYAWKDAVVKPLSLPDADMVDTDDEQFPLEKPEPVKEVTRPLRKVIDMFQAAATKADLEAARNEVKKYPNWSPGERTQLNNENEKAKGRVK